MTGDDQSLLHMAQSAFTPSPPKWLGVAVSGGSDSVALLHLLAEWAAQGGPQLLAVTVDHGLRSEAAAEAAFVAQTCAGLGVAHQTLEWRGWDGHGNLQDQARRARYGLMAAWATGQGIATVALGHTLDDQAETFLMRLARGSGVDGLSGMARRRLAEGVSWVRPLLELRRADLRAYLKRRGAAWVDDPSNIDAAYDRVKARQILSALAPLGITAETLVETAARLSMARQALRSAAHVAARALCRIEAGDVVIARQGFALLPLDIQLRLLAHAIGWVASADYRPRLTSLTQTHAALAATKRSTLGGCVLSANKRDIRISREVQAVKTVISAITAPWDRRWHLSGPAVPGLIVQALGEPGLAQCPDWRATGLPRATLLASPSVWRGTALVAAPHAGRADGWSAELHKGPEDFFASLIVH